MAIHALRNVSFESLRVFVSDIKLAHSIFALPFVVSGILISNMKMPTSAQILWIFLAMICARSFAMGMNRFLDSDIDLLNERTARRAIPAGKLDSQSGLVISCLFGIGFVVSAFALSHLAGWCSFPLLVVLASYSLMKRYTFLTHWYLGLCLGLAPIGAQIALAGHLDIQVALLGVAVTLWTAGFDILYALQDRSFDVNHKLQSVPAVFGIKWSLHISSVCFLLMIGCLAYVGMIMSYGATYYAGVALCSVILVLEHIAVRRGLAQRKNQLIEASFMNANAMVSVIFMLFTILEIGMR
jgi:4-hydroxybenzoate polyprenyltransferase